MANSNLTPSAAQLEEALTVLFCLIDDAYHLLNNPGGSDACSSLKLKRLSDSEVLTLALFQQLRGLQSERSFLRDAARFFSHLFPGVVGLHPSSLHRRVRKLRRFLEPLRRSVVRESSSATLRRWCSTRRCFLCSTPGRFVSRRAGERLRVGRHG